MPEPQPTAVCFGEILWDFLPRGIFAGGAPFNVAYHLHRLGFAAHLVSGIGRDLLGQELVRRLRHWGLATDGLTRHQGLPTGYVTATLGATGDAGYEITPSVAWDQIGIGEDTLRAAVRAQAVVFGSLALRSAFNRAALDRLLAVIPAGAERVFDVNLRPPHDDLPLVRQLASRATLLKLNLAEAARLAETEAAADPARLAAVLAERHGCPTVCLTAGARGAGLLADGRWHWADARPVVVRDTVGAGDAFLAGLLAGRLLHREPPAKALARACRLGEFVAARDGATPPYSCDSAGLPVD
ncbi:MAG: carbohydrate kinase [Opitutaceae bacterium]|nr:carbohydrate kinase [Opitutaceae bacterium]